MTATMKNGTKGKSVTLGGLGLIGGPGSDHYPRMAAITRIVAVDPDTVEASNQAAQCYSAADVNRKKIDVRAARMEKANPSLEVTRHAALLQDVPRGALESNALVDSFDSRLSRLHGNRIAASLGMPLFDAGIRRDGLLGRLTVVHAKTGACLECAWTPAHYASLERRYACLGSDSPVAPTNSFSEHGALVAAYQALECRKWLSGDLDLSAGGYQLLIDLVHHELIVSKLVRNPQCRCTHTPWEIQRLGKSPSELRLGDALQLGGNGCGAGPFVLKLEGKAFVCRLTCSTCGKSRRLLRLHHRLAKRHRRCSNCEGRHPYEMVAGGFDMIDKLDESLGTAVLDRPLRRFGLCGGDVFSIRGAGGERHFELAKEPGDRRRQ